MGKKPDTRKVKPSVKIGPIGGLSALILIVVYVIQLQRMGVTDSPRGVSYAIGTLVGVILLSALVCGIASRFGSGRRHLPGIAFAVTALIAGALGLARVSDRMGGVETPEVVRLKQVTAELDQVAQERLRRNEFPLLTHEESSRRAAAFRDAAASTRGLNRHVYNTEADIHDQLLAVTTAYGIFSERPDIERKLDPTTLTSENEVAERLRVIAEVKPLILDIMDFMSGYEKFYTQSLVSKGVSASVAAEIARKATVAANAEIVLVQKRTELETLDAIEEMTKILGRNVGKFQIDRNGDLQMDARFPDADLDRYNTQVEKINRALKNQELLLLRLPRGR